MMDVTFKVFIQAARIILQDFDMPVWRNFEPLSCYVTLLPTICATPSTISKLAKRFISNHLGESCFRFLTEISDIRFIVIWECSNKRAWFLVFSAAPGNMPNIFAACEIVADVLLVPFPIEHC